MLQLWCLRIWHLPTAKHTVRILWISELSSRLLQNNISIKIGCDHASKTFPLRSLQFLRKWLKLTTVRGVALSRRNHRSETSDNEADCWAKFLGENQTQTDSHCTVYGLVNVILSSECRKEHVLVGFDMTSKNLSHNCCVSCATPWCRDDGNERLIRNRMKIAWSSTVVEESNAAIRSCIGGLIAILSPTKCRSTYCGWFWPLFSKTNCKTREAPNLFRRHYLNQFLLKNTFLKYLGDSLNSERSKGMRGCRWTSKVANVMTGTPWSPWL